MLRNLTAGALLLTLVAAQVSAWPGGRGGRGGSFGGSRNFNNGRNYNGYRNGNFGGQVIDDRAAGEGRPTLADDNGGELRNAVENQSPFRNFNGQGDRNQSIRNGQFQQNAQAFRQNMQKTASELGDLYGSDHEPFSPSWYLDHPNAWQITHPYADAFVAANALTIGNWLGINAVAATGNDDGDYNGGDDNSFDNDDNGQNIDLPQGDWLPLGVFALGAVGQSESNTLIQLAVDRQGDLRGTYYDILTNEAQDIRGNVDKSTRTVTFTIGNNSKVTFETGLEQLTEQAAQVNVRFPGGNWQWQLVKLEK